MEIDPSATTYWATKSISIRLQPLSSLSGMRRNFSGGAYFRKKFWKVCGPFCKFCKLIVNINFVRLKLSVSYLMFSKVFVFWFFSSPTTIHYQLGAVGTYRALSWGTNSLVSMFYNVHTLHFQPRTQFQKIIIYRISGLGRYGGGRRSLRNSTPCRPKRSPL